MMNLKSFSQNDTINSTIQLTKPVAKLVIKDLINADGLSLELKNGLTAEIIDQMLIDRAEARANGDFSRADAIRDELKKAGIIIEDGAAGATWRRA